MKMEDVQPKHKVGDEVEVFIIVKKTGMVHRRVSKIISISDDGKVVMVKTGWNVRCTIGGTDPSAFWTFDEAKRASMNYCRYIANKYQEAADAAGRRYEAVNRQKLPL